MRHIDAMEELLGSTQSPNGPTGPRRRLVTSGLRTVSILVVAFGLGMAIAASSNRVPGDPFYRAKRVAEQPVQLVARGIVAENRVGELEELIERGAGPQQVMTARTDAAVALLNVEPEDELKRALSLLAWPGGLAGRGVDVSDSQGALTISSSQWIDGDGYTASLADGHLVTISASSGELLIGTTGKWIVATTGLGWLLSSEDSTQIYFIQRMGDDLRVESNLPLFQPSEGSGDPGRGEQVLGVPMFDTDGPLDEVASPETGDQTLFRTTSTVDTAAASPSGAPGTATGSNPNEAPVTGPANTTPAGTDGATSPGPTSGPATTVSGTGVGSTSLPTSPSTVPVTTTPTPTTAPVDTTVPVPTTVAVPTTTVTTAPEPSGSGAVAWSAYLRNPGSGNTSSSRILELSGGSAPGGSLANYDTDRDGDPGLMLAKDGAGLSTSDRTKHQIWEWTAPSATALAGDAELAIWLAAKDLKTDERIGLLASLEWCDGACTRLGTAQWSGAGSDGFRRASVGFGSIDVTIPAGATVRLKVVVPDGLATTDVWFAYDSGSHASRLNIG